SANRSPKSGQDSSSAAASSIRSCAVIDSSPSSLSRTSGAIPNRSSRWSASPPSSDTSAPNPRRLAARIRGCTVAPRRSRRRRYWRAGSSTRRSSGGVSLGQVFCQLLNAFAGAGGSEDFDVVAELQELAYRLDIGVSDDGRAPARRGVGHLAEPVAEDSAREIEAVRAEPDANLHPA